MDPQLIDPFSNALLHKNWTAITGFVIVFLVHLAKKGGLTTKLNVKLLPLVSAGLGVILAVGDNLISATTATNVPQTIIRGVLAGISATGLWELVFKHYSAAVNAPPVIAAVTPPAPTPVVPAEVPAPVVVQVPVVVAPAPVDPPAEAPAPAAEVVPVAVVVAPAEDPKPQA